ncbi:MAG: hypothetical protein HC860_05875 [Alkalinema sp. RU_4_3]|nr:hypothetical protein [Alkalinema sp. RU_4_3]
MTTAYQSAWIPTAQVTHHSGSPLHPNAVFFAPPPPEIGAVITAAGTDSNPSNWGILGFLLLLLLAGVTMTVGYLIFNAIGTDASLSWLGGGLLAVLTSWFFGVQIRDRYFERPESSYVGELGVARYWQTRKGLEGNILRFSETSGLYKKVTQVYRNNLYQGLSFDLTWNNQTSRKPFTIQGWAEQGKSTSYSFGLAAERIWTKIRLDRAQTELAQIGVTRFSTDYGTALEVGSGFINVILPSGEIKRINANEIELNSGDGKLEIRRVRRQSIEETSFNLRDFVYVIVKFEDLEDINAFLYLFHAIVLRTSILPS